MKCIFSITTRIHTFLDPVISKIIEKKFFSKIDPPSYALSYRIIVFPATIIRIVGGCMLKQSSNSLHQKIAKIGLFVSSSGKHAFKLMRVN